MKKVVIRSVIVTLSFLALSVISNTKLYAGKKRHFFPAQKGIETLEWGRTGWHEGLSLYPYQ